MLTSGSSFVEQATIRLPGAISSVLQKVPDGALGIGTSLLSGFMFSARLSKLRPAIAARLPVSVKTQVLPALQRSKSALLGWLKAQATLAGITCCILAVGFLILRVPYWPVWAVAVALVDAVPLLGTGTVLIPWAVIDLIRGQHFMAIGLLCLYGVSFFTRTILEPRLVGRQLGIDPLVTLVFLYLGYRFWGIWGMLLSPMLVAALVAAGQGNKKGCA
jgi:sporulation integral membrane protein YtvI